MHFLCTSYVNSLFIYSLAYKRTLFTEQNEFQPPQLIYINKKKRSRMHTEKVCIYRKPHVHNIIKEQPAKCAQYLRGVYNML